MKALLFFFVYSHLISSSAYSALSLTDEPPKFSTKVAADGVLEFEDLIFTTRRVGEIVTCNTSSGEIIDHSFTQDFICTEAPYQEICQLEKEWNFASMKREQEQVKAEEEKLNQALQKQLKSKIVQAELFKAQKTRGIYIDNEAKKECLNKVGAKHLITQSKLVASHYLQSVKSNITEFTKGFADYFSATYGSVLPKAHLELMGQFLNRCSQNITTFPGDDFNAMVINAMGLSESIELVEKVSKSFQDKKINPTKILLNEDSFCQITLSTRAMAACKLGMPLCGQTLMHEMAHLLNPCAFYMVHFQAKDVASLINTEKFDGDSLFRKNITNLSNNLAANTLSLAKNLFHGSKSCLGLMPEVPHSAPANSCSSAPEWEKYGGDFQDYQRFCGRGSSSGTAEGFPAQWPEAQADLAAASALAYHLNKKYPNKTPHRRQFVYQVMKQWCGMVDNDFTNAKHFHTDKHIMALSGISQTQKADACADKPRGPAQKAWIDSHQTSEVRFNNFYMRNADLRTSLGCRALVSGIPSCNERNKIVTPLPRTGR